MLARLPKILSEAENNNDQFKIMVLLGGTNDLGAGEPDKVIRNLLKMHEMAESKGILTIAVAIPKNRSLRFPRDPLSRNKS